MSRPKVSKRARELKKQKETLTLQMQFFCLDPQFQLYENICNSQLANEGKHFDLWKLAALFTYGKKWIEDEYLDSGFDLREIIEQFADEKKKLLKRIIEKPTAAKIDHLWYIFFASGDANMMLYIFRAAGNERASLHLRETIVDMYVTFSSEYRDKIDEIQQKPQFITGHQIGPERLNKTIQSFQTIEALISQEQEKTAGMTKEDVKALIEQKELKKIVMK